jgi:hypothetical protein
MGVVIMFKRWALLKAIFKGQVAIDYVGKTDIIPGPDDVTMGGHQ